MSLEEIRGRAGKHIDKIAFAGAVVAGVATIAAVDAADASKWIAVAICVALMVAYMLAALLLAGLRLRADQTADNLYYLGLLYTLASLGVALIRFASSEQATTSILRNFGIAIFTTIVGVGLRVFVGQFREDPEDIEYEAKAALSDSVRHMRAELDLSVAQLRGFADGMKQVVADFTDKATQSTAQALDGAVARFGSAADAMGQRFGETADTFARRVEAFDASLERVVVALEGLMERLAAVRVDADMVEQGLRPALSALEAAARGFAGAIDSERATFDAGAKAVAAFVETSGRLAAAGQVLASAADRLRTAASSAGEASQVVAQLDRAAGVAMQSTLAFGARLSEIAAGLENRNAKAAEAAAAEARERLASVEAAAGRVTETLGRLDAEFAGSGDTVQRVRRELTELVGWIIARLDRR
ncbi:MAG: hypothetical protein ACR2F8_02005 [Caulobacteraceae bacterium]